MTVGCSARVPPLPFPETLGRFRNPAFARGFFWWVAASKLQRSQSGEKMATIIAARVQTQQRAQELMEQLLARGLPASDMQAFYVNPPGQHDLLPIGGDVDADTGTQKSGGGQAAGVAAGAAAGWPREQLWAPQCRRSLRFCGCDGGCRGARGWNAGALSSTRSADGKKGNRNSTPDHAASNMRRPE